MAGGGEGVNMKGGERTNVEGGRGGGGREGRTALTGYRENVPRLLQGVLNKSNTY
jgi:hypothetical protein